MGCSCAGSIQTDDGEYSEIYHDEQRNFVNEQAVIGLSKGGAKDANNFRECIKNDIMPSNGSITSNGVLYEYNFDTSSKTGKEELKQDLQNDLFYPTYCYAKTKKLNLNNQTDNATDTKCNEYEYYLSVGLNSSIKQTEFKRKHLNLIVSLDVSGSMRSTFDKNTPTNAVNTKLKVAKDAIISLYKHLTPKDRIAVITFNESAKIIQKLEFVYNINIDKLKENILSINANGKTNLEDAYKVANHIYQQLNDMDHAQIDEKIDEKVDECEQLNPDKTEEYSNRVIFFTDAEINEGEISAEKLLSMVNKYANGNNKIYSTFIGIGLDFNAKLVEQLSNTRGCNYYYVKTVNEFMNRMNKETFEYMVTPLVFNICLRLICEGNSCIIDKVFGTNEETANNIKDNGQILKIHTLFPSKRVANVNDESKMETKGGIQLIQLRKKNSSNDNKNDSVTCELEVTFEDTNGKSYVNKQFITFESDGKNDNFYDNDGIRKAILLCKYVELMSEWIKKNNSNLSNESDKVMIDNQYKNLMIKFLDHFEKEMNELNDETLKKEVDIMRKLIDCE